MALTSKTMRCSAITYLFAFIYLSWTEDFEMWLDILSREPQLRFAVRTVKFYPEGYGSSRRELRRNLLKRRGPSVVVSDFSTMAPMPNVQSVIYKTSSADLTVAVPFLLMFPNMTQLDLTSAFDDFDGISKFLGACGKLHALNLVNVKVNDEGGLDKTFPHSSLFDLSALRKLTVKRTQPPNLIVDLMNHSSPVALESLCFGEPATNAVCSIAAMEKLLTLGVESLHKLVLDLTLDYAGTFLFIHSFSLTRFVEELEVVEMLQRRRLFPSLDSVAVWFVPESPVTIDLFPTAPKLTTMGLRIPCYWREKRDFQQDVKYLTDVLGTRLMKNDFTIANLLRRFPQFRQLIFQLYPPTDSYLHRDLDSRRTLESLILETIEDQDLANRVSFQWLNWECELIPDSELRSEVEVDVNLVS
ncbi:hypothetical protein C8J57DRAFT_1721911 [Mycena rebaudengoi]|nr:hypothetical protein C8J57DRAFT_1721911 [Mycena rebaudengoi]